MGNICSNGVYGRRRTLPTPQPHPEITSTEYLQYPQSNPNLPPPQPFVEHREAVTIRNDVELKKDTLRMEADVDGKCVVAFTFDAAVAGSLTIIFFAKEGEDCSLTATKGNLFPPVTVRFQQGLYQNFRQPTAIDLEALEENLSKIEDDEDIHPLAIKAEVCPGDDENYLSTHSQITLAAFEKVRGEYYIKAVEQFLWINCTKYELHEFYGIGISADYESSPGKECVLCLSQPRDTVVIPCRHMCMCIECAKVLKFHTNKCPICSCLVESLLLVEVNNESEECRSSGHQRIHPPHHHPQPEINANRYVFAPATDYPRPLVEHRKAVTIRNNVELKKDTLRFEADVDGKRLVAFTFDAAVSGSITIIFFAKEGEDCDLTATKGNLFPPFTMHFQQGLKQKFRQPSGTGIDLKALEKHLLKIKENEDIYPLAVKAEKCREVGESYSSANSQITKAALKKDNGEYRIEVVKQILWVNGIRYELQDIYGSGNSAECESSEGNYFRKECVICLYQPRDTTVMPCRHMCICSECAEVLKFQTDRCPICNRLMESLIQMEEVNNESDDW